MLDGRFDAVLTAVLTHTLPADADPEDAYRYCTERIEADRFYPDGDPHTMARYALRAYLRNVYRGSGR